MSIEADKALALRIERRHLLGEVTRDTGTLRIFPGGFLVFCDGDAPEVLERARQIKLICNEKGMEEEWPSDDLWPDFLPDWFVDACHPERTSEEYEQDRLAFRQMTREEEMEDARNEQWSLSEFVSWMDPEAWLEISSVNWIWWDAVLKDENTIRIHIGEMGDPPPGAPPGFSWLFRASGAKAIDEAVEPEDMV